MQSTGMSTRAAAGLLLVAVVAGFTGHLLGGRAVAANPAPPQLPVLSGPLTPELAPAPARGSHILWMFVQGRWRAVPS